MAFQAVYIPKGKGYYSYKRWHRRTESLIMKTLGVEIKQPTLWDRISRKRKTNKIN